MGELEIQAQSRVVFGNKARQLRQQGLIPANVYGHGIASYPIQIDAKQLGQVLARAGTSKLVDLRLPSEREARRAIVRHVQRDPVTHKLLHVDFYQVRMSEKLKAEVHLNYVGEPPAVAAGQCLLLRNLASIEVECLPDNLPQSIQVDLSDLETLDEAVHVRDLVVPPGVTVLTDIDELVAKVVAVRVEKEEEAVKPEAPVEAAPEAVEEEESA